MDPLFALAIFCMVTLFTPGPNNHGNYLAYGLGATASGCSVSPQRLPQSGVAEKGVGR